MNSPKLVYPQMPIKAEKTLGPNAPCSCAQAARKRSVIPTTIWFLKSWSMLNG